MRFLLYLCFGVIRSFSNSFSSAARAALRACSIRYERRVRNVVFAFFTIIDFSIIFECADQRGRVRRCDRSGSSRRSEYNSQIMAPGPTITGNIRPRLLATL
jgi:hypothetical protein